MSYGSVAAQQRAKSGLTVMRSSDARHCQVAESCTRPRPITLIDLTSVRRSDFRPHAACCCLCCLTCLAWPVQTHGHAVWHVLLVPAGLFESLNHPLSLSTSSFLLYLLTGSSILESGLPHNSILELGHPLFFEVFGYNECFVSCFLKITIFYY
jgi:hypothetical protein